MRKPEEKSKRKKKHTHKKKHRQFSTITKIRKSVEVGLTWPDQNRRCRSPTAGSVERAGAGVNPVGVHLRRLRKIDISQTAVVGAQPLDVLRELEPE
jgi:hypothetical protein